MHKIDIHNYEAYLLDFSEGNLTGELQVELELFLIQHPELAINLEDLQLVSLEEETTTFLNKNSLKKLESDLVSETQFIAYIEHELTDKEKLELEKSCASNPSLTKELKLYTHTIAEADTNIIFENKQSLKRKPKVIWLNFSMVQYAAAACVVFLIGLFMLWPKTHMNSESLVLAAKTTNVAPKKEHFIEKSNPSEENNGAVISTPEKTSPSLIQHLAANKNQQHLLTSNATVQSVNTISKDSANKIISNSSVLEQPKKETLIALNTAPQIKEPSSSNTVVQVITENEDEATTDNTRKKGIWATASRALKNLNNVGVKTVNGDEENTKQNTAYAITLGGISITHKAGL